LTAPCSKVFCIPSYCAARAIFLHLIALVKLPSPALAPQRYTICLKTSLKPFLMQQVLFSIEGNLVFLLARCGHPPQPLFGRFGLGSEGERGGVRGGGGGGRVHVGGAIWGWYFFSLRQFPQSPFPQRCSVAFAQGLSCALPFVPYFPPLMFVFQCSHQ